MDREALCDQDLEAMLSDDATSYPYLFFPSRYGYSNDISNVRRPLRAGWDDRTCPWFWFRTVLLMNAGEVQIDTRARVLVVPRQPGGVKQARLIRAW